MGGIIITAGKRGRRRGWREGLDSLRVRNEGRSSPDVDAKEANDMKGHQGEVKERDECG